MVEATFITTLKKENKKQTKSNINKDKNKNTKELKIKKTNKQKQKKQKKKNENMITQFMGRSYDLFRNSFETISELSSAIKHFVENVNRHYKKKKNINGPC